MLTVLLATLLRDSTSHPFLQASETRPGYESEKDRRNHTRRPEAMSCRVLHLLKTKSHDSEILSLDGCYPALKYDTLELNVTAQDRHHLSLQFNLDLIPQVMCQMVKKET